MLKEYPVEKWNGGKIQRITPSIIHLMRGQVFEIGGCRIFTFGGAQSHDIQGGILEPNDPNFRKKKHDLDKGFLPYRINHISWWKEELPSKEEYEEGLQNIGACGGEVDYVVTHCSSTTTQAVLSKGMYKSDHLTDYLMEVEERLKYKKWFFGHYHDNQNVDEKHILVYEQIMRIW